MRAKEAVNWLAVAAAAAVCTAPASAPAQPLPSGQCTVQPDGDRELTGRDARGVIVGTYAPDGRAGQSYDFKLEFAGPVSAARIEIGAAKFSASAARTVRAARIIIASGLGIGETQGVMFFAFGTAAEGLRSESPLSNAEAAAIAGQILKDPGIRKQARHAAYESSVAAGRYPDAIAIDAAYERMMEVIEAVGIQSLPCQPGAAPPGRTRPSAQPPQP